MNCVIRFVETAQPNFSISPGSVSFDAADGNKTVIITSNTNWSVKCSANWLTVGKSSGNGNNSLTLKAAVNTGTSSRSATVVFTYGSSATRTLSVSQSGYVPVTGVGLNKTSLSMTENDIVTLIAIVSPSNATNKNVTWTSSSTSIATVDQNGLVTAKAPSEAIITVRTADGSKTATCRVSVTRNTVPVTDVSIDRERLFMPVGTSSVLTASVSPLNESKGSVTWSSTNGAIVSVDDRGRVTARSTGFATIIATASDNSSVKATCAVTVGELYLNKKNLTLKVGASETLYNTMSPLTVKPSHSPVWRSTDSSIAKVSANGKVTAVRIGRATIICTAFVDDTIVEASCTVDVTDGSQILVSEIMLDSIICYPVVGNATVLKATVTPDNATNKTLIWTASDASVATVDGNGRVSAVSPGTALITVTAADGSGKHTSRKVEVRPIKTTGLALDWTSRTLNRNVGFTLIATVSPANASDKSVRWTSSNTAVATVTTSGYVKAVGCSGRLPLDTQDELGSNR